MFFICFALQVPKQLAMLDGQNSPHPTCEDAYLLSYQCVPITWNYLDESYFNL